MGDPAIPEMVNIYRLPDEEQQTTRVDGLPVGTRGGLLIRSEFPLDGEYVLKVALTGTSGEEQKLEITVDGERVQLATIAASQGGGRGGRGGAGLVAAADDAGAGPGRRGRRAPLEFRIPVKAGPRAHRSDLHRTQ